jgi:hypothetical protein
MFSHDFWRVSHIFPCFSSCFPMISWDLPWFSHLPPLQGPHQRSLRGLGVRADARAPLRSWTLGGTVDPPVNQQFATEHMAHLEFMDTYGYIYIILLSGWYMCWIFLLDLDGSSIWMIYILKFLDVFRDILPYIYIYISYLRWSGFEVSDFFRVSDFGDIQCLQNGPVVIKAWNLRP